MPCSLLMSEKRLYETQRETYSVFKSYQDNYFSNLKYLYVFFLVKIHYKKYNRDFPGGPVVKNLPSNAGDAGSIPGHGTETPHATGQLSPCATTTEPASRKL